MHELFKKVLSSFKIDKEELEIVKVQLEEQMAGFFKSKMDNETALRTNLNGVKKKLDTIEERFVIGEIDRGLYDKFRVKYENERFEIEQELDKTQSYSSNLKKVVRFAIKICHNPLLLWESSVLENKKIFQKTLFPDGIFYNRESDRVLTTRVNSFFSLVPQILGHTREQKKGDSVNFNKIPAFVGPLGLEPRMTVPKTGVLPLHHGPMRVQI